MPLAIISCGSEQVKEIRKLLADSPHSLSVEKWDLRSHLVDYRPKDVACGKDSDNPQTASAVYAISQFPETVITIVEGISDKPILLLQCNRGYSRSHCVAKTVETLLNSMMIGD